MITENVRDFNLTHIFECGQCFRWNAEAAGAADTAGAYVGIADGNVCRAKCTAEGLLELDATGGDEAFWRHYFDMETDYGLVKRTLVTADPLIENACDFGFGIRILNQELFETLISFIISQNNNIPRIKKNIEDLCRRYGKSLGKVFGEERYAFPAAEKLALADPMDLASMKLGYRSEYIVRAARRFAEEGAPADMEEVLSYHGIGPKVANCIMLFGLHRVDAFPIDTWVKHIMNDMYGFDEKDVRGMADFAAGKFGAYAGYAQQYLFYYYRERR